MKTENYRSIAKELLQIFFKYNRIKYFKSMLSLPDLKRFEELESKLAGSGVCMLCGVPKERHGTCCGEKNAIQIESFRVDNFNQKRLMKDLDDDIETIRKQFEKPSDYDIENAANEYAEENQHQRRSSYGKLHKAYTEGAKDMRDGRIYISPKSSKDYFKPDEDGAM